MLSIYVSGGLTKFVTVPVGVTGAPVGGGRFPPVSRLFRTLPRPHPVGTPLVLETGDRKSRATGA